MRKVLVGIVVLLGLAGAAAWYLGYLRVGLQGTFCNIDGGLAASDRAAMETVARQYLAAALAGRIDDKKRLMTDEARAAVERAPDPQKSQAMLRQIGPFSPARLEHFYTVSSAGAGSVSRTQCMAPGSSDWVSLQTLPGRRQAYALFTTTGRGGDDWAITEWLLRDNGAWRVENFAITHASMAGHDAADLLKQARRERDAGHGFNATMLYAGAQSLAGRGPILQLALERTIAGDEQSYAMASELAGKPPLAWGMNGNVYSVQHVTIQSVFGKLGLSFNLPQKAWGSPDAAEASNHAFLTDFVAAHPDAPGVFSYLIARALKPDNSGGWATVWSAEKGFLPPPKH